MYQKSVTHYITKIVVDIMFYFGIIATAALPFLSRRIGIYFLGFENQFQVPFVAILFLSGLCGIYILFNLKQMFRSLLSGNPFIDENVRHFRKMAAACFVVSLLYLAKCIFMYTIGTLIIAAIFAVGCLFCLTLKDLFKQAVNFKEENDLTI